MQVNKIELLKDEPSFLILVNHSETFYVQGYDDYDRNERERREWLKIIQVTNSEELKDWILENPKEHYKVVQCAPVKVEVKALVTLTPPTSLS